MNVIRISSLPEAPDVPISSLNVNISQFFDMGRKNGKNGKNKLNLLEFLGRNLLIDDL